MQLAAVAAVLQLLLAAVGVVAAAADVCAASSGGRNKNRALIMSGIPSVKTRDATKRKLNSGKTKTFPMGI